MEALSKGDLPAGELTPSHPVWRAAAKAMARWSPAPQVTDEIVRLYYRCKAMHGRCSANLIDKESTKQREHSSGVSVETAFWLVPKTNFRAAATCAGGDIQVPADVAAYHVSPAIIEEQMMLGCQLDFANYFVIDQACSRTLLGMGASQVVLKVKAVDRVTWKVAVTPDEVPPAEDNVRTRGSTAPQRPSSEGGEVVALHPAAPGAATSESVVMSPTKKARVLERSRSDPKMITRELLDIMQTAANTGAFYSTDPNDNKTVELWVRWTLRGAKNSVTSAAAAATGAAIVEKPMILTLFGKFLCKLLLEHDSYDALPQIVGCFKDLAALGVEVPPRASSSRSSQGSISLGTMSSLKRG